MALGAFIAREFWAATRVEVAISGIEDGAQLTLQEASRLDVRIDIADLDLETGVTPTLFFDGFPAPEETYEVSETGVRWTPPALEEGIHELSMSVGRPMLDAAEFTWRFLVDGTPPFIDVLSPQPAAPICSPVTVTGRAETGLAQLTVDGEDLEIDEDFLRRVREA